MTTTPSVERAARSLRDDGAYSDDVAREYLAQHALTAALNDPDDPDSLARTLYVAFHTGRTEAKSRQAWCWIDVFERDHWRAVADGLRMMLTGSGS